MGKEYKRLNLNGNLEELPEGMKEEFPLEVYTDAFDEFIGRELPMHWQAGFEFNLMERGTAVYRVSGQEIPLLPGDVLFINGGAMHLAHGEKGAAVLGTAFAPGVLFGEGYCYRKYVHPVLAHGADAKVFPAGSAEAEGIAREIRALHAADTKKTGYEMEWLARAGNIWRILFPTMESSGKESSGGENLKILRGMITEIRHASGEMPSADDLCRGAGISRSTLFRLFQQYVGCTPVQFMNDIRLAKAAAALKGGRSSIADIAEECGFSQQSYFTGCFRKKYGMSPSEYRKKCMEEKINL